MSSSIKIKGAREHNLKNIDIEIPRDKLVVISGLSGSGKSSLAFDTLYAEGQRRYVESLSAYARQFLGQLEKPDVDSIEGLSPAISIEQKTTHRNPRSTVGTVTEIYDYLRLLFARIGKPHCPSCRKRLSAQSLDSVVDSVLALYKDNALKIQVLSPIIRSKKGEFRDLFQKLRKDGFIRVRVDGDIFNLDESISLKKNNKHDIDVIIDRLVLKNPNDRAFRSRLTESIELAQQKSEGMSLIMTPDAEHIFSNKLHCSSCDISFPEISHRSFSFNSPEGACEDCSGLGAIMEFHPDLIIQNPDQPLIEGLGKGLGWSGEGFWFRATIKALSEVFNFDVNKVTWEKLSQKVKDVILHGDRKLKLNYKIKNTDSDYQFNRTFEGIIPNLHRRYEQTNSDAMRQRMEQYMKLQPCTSCESARLKPAPLSVTIGKKNIYQTTQLSVSDSLGYFREIKLTDVEQKIASQALKEVVDRLHFLNSVGVGYLTLDRMAGTLSGGEAQRIRLATQIGSALQGVMYVLDEPSIGLHQSDNTRLISTLKGLRDLGNTVIVVEHDEETIENADFIIDMGPGAGVHGGEVTFAGTFSELTSSKGSLTGEYISGKKTIQIPEKRRAQNWGKSLTLQGAEHNNLKKIDVSIPLKNFVTVTGVSGSGKSSLINEVLYKALANQLGQSQNLPGKYKSLGGLDHIDKVIEIDQSPIGRTPRSNPATYTGAFTPIRELFSKLPESSIRGYAPGRFSFNVPGGRCEACQGDGVKKIEMHFLSDVYVTCEVCKGARYNRETLEVNYKGKTIYDVLNLTVEEAAEFFSAIPAIYGKLKSMVEVGLGYVRLGQPATTLSGGEAQRVKLATELAKRSTGKTLYILDEPTTGLHFEDINQLLKVLHRFVDNGNTVLVIEHNMDVIKTADYLIDIGPGGGDSGGELIGNGTPEEISQNESSITGSYLKKWLKGKKEEHGLLQDN
jgi:excinuclease ABC subunit A